ncbi:MAG: AbrB/MazE/SpoVT family DNA-binding domain-containing protein [Candidatus Eremiobacteraeota bacterium]|nr:AbrB/MazE/SpoVT family DNA-binding domain-containing protein [Candidatus Eremiobacteraeota bacterium]MBC5827499.1 AbrB/MazE/SpoVT family DNA-binding domain-containing protein [Candidatus Eremiobacteraeota bacterium]
MKTTIRTWGNSLALRIPRTVSEDLGIAKNTAVNIMVDGGLLIVTPVSGRTARLQKMLKRITPDNLPDEKELFGKAVGRELW